MAGGETPQRFLIYLEDEWRPGHTAPKLLEESKIRVLWTWVRFPPPPLVHRGKGFGVSHKGRETKGLGWTFVFYPLIKYIPKAKGVDEQNHGPPIISNGASGPERAS